MAVSLSVWAEDQAEHFNYIIRLGYNVGGTAPMGMPASIRALNSFKPQATFALSFDVQRDFWGKWGALAGLHVEDKGMKIDARVKNYHMAIDQKGNKLEGMYTGCLVTECFQSLYTLPVMVTYRPGRWLLKFGPYVSYVSSSEFSGSVYDGYLRVGDPTGEKVVMGKKGENNPTFDFSKDMRNFQWGLTLGADCQLNKRWGVYFDLNWGLSGAFESSFKTIEQTLYPIYGTLGVSYRLK